MIRKTRKIEETDEELPAMCVITIDPMLRNYEISYHFDIRTSPENMLEYLESLVDHYKDNPQQLLDDANVLETQ
jgi:hypothetical protein